MRDTREVPWRASLTLSRELAGLIGPPGSVIYTGPSDPNLRVVREINTENHDPEMHFTVLVVEAAAE